ncbi:hypothetical protein FGF66_06285 [Chlorobaculum thiosulfatiphilum]|uniref:Uncharacterized protein n=1 Tax=Chlorobaculum thiosulfatiphilum TaxID=115852 RepID=A0A5C4S784_CHLTI|nr:hypothetical protein [Chlorobaculum thiosulfatiphilum]TNJ39017.1 hypothetical protein FGF66_06285 [Chlorobaculum thiosulfatiphilum]
MYNKIHPDVVLDEADEALDEPNFNNFNTSPDPPSPYADLEKKYRKNKFNKTRNSTSPGLYGTHGLAPVNGTKPAGKKFQKKKSKSAVAPKPFRAPNGNKSA